MLTIQMALSRAKVTQWAATKLGVVKLSVPGDEAACNAVADFLSDNRIKGEYVVALSTNTNEPRAYIITLSGDGEEFGRACRLIEENFAYENPKG